MRITRTEEKQFRLLYGLRRNGELAQHFGWTLSEVEDLALTLALGKDKRVFRGRNMPRWGKDEVVRLIEMYPHTGNIDIARALGRSEKAVIAKAHNLNLKKDAARLSQMGRNNVRQRKDRSQLKLL